MIRQTCPPLAALLLALTVACSGTDGLAPEPSSSASAIQGPSERAFLGVGASSGVASVLDQRDGNAGRAGAKSLAAEGGNAAAARCENQPAYEGSAIVGPGGGTITAGPWRLIIPPGALTSQVHVTATLPEGDGTYVEFQPSGIQFRKSAALIFDASTCDVSTWTTPSVVYIEHGQVVEWIAATYLPHLQQVAAPVDHFSGYALMM